MATEDHDMIVEFGKHCKTCKYEKLNEEKHPCCICLEYPTRVNSSTPVKWEPKEKTRKKR